MTDDKAPAARSATIRSRIGADLRTAPASAHDLSTLVRIPEKDVAAHLEHLEKSLRAHGARLVIEPARCLACGFVFRERRRFTTPGSCPSCRSERIAAPRFSIAER